MNLSMLDNLPKVEDTFF